MYKKGIALCLAVIFISVYQEAHADEKTPKKAKSERLIAQIDSSWIQESIKVSPDSKRVAYGAAVGNKRFVGVDGKAGEKYDGLTSHLIFSPDSKRVAYGDQVGNEWFVIVDGKEGEKKYDSIVAVTFSPDSKRVAYVAGVGDKMFVVVDGKAGDEYLVIGDGRIIFDSPDSLHYLAFKGNGIYLIEEGIK